MNGLGRFFREVLKLYILTAIATACSIHQHPMPPPASQSTRVPSVAMLGWGEQAASRSQWGVEGEIEDPFHITSRLREVRRSRIWTEPARRSLLIAVIRG